MKKCIISIIAILLLSIILSGILFEVQALGIETVTGNPGAYIQGGGNDGKAADIGRTIVGIIRAIGIAILTLTLTIIGIKYILASVEEKAQYKQAMIPYVIGAVLIFAGSQVTQIIYNAVH